MDPFLENAQRIFDVARSDDSGAPGDFALLIRPDGGLHFVMESPLSLDAAAIYGGARTAYRITRVSGGGVRVEGRNGSQECVIEQRATHHARRELLRDQPLYWITSPLTLSAASAT
jgi:hypothetical protein